VNNTEHRAPKPSTSTGSLAQLRALLCRMGSSAPSAARRCAIAVGAFTALLALAATPAIAEETHTFSTSFGAPGSAAGQLSLTSGSSLAINDETGDIYVADTGNHRVDEFTSSGAFIRAWGWGVLNGAKEFQICTSSCQGGLSGSENTEKIGSKPGQFEAPTFIAVDNSPGGNGDVYVADTGNNGEVGNLVTKFDATGHLITTWGKAKRNPGPEGQLDGETATSPLEGPFGQNSIEGIAVDSSGTLYVLANGFYTTTGGRESVIFEFHPNGTFHQGFPVAGNGNERTAGLAADSAGKFFDVTPEGGSENNYAAIEQLTFEEAHQELIHHGYVGAGAYATGLAFDSSAANDELYVARPGKIDHYAFNASGEILEPGSPPCVVLEERQNYCSPTDFFGFFGPNRLSQGTGIAVDPSDHDVYVGEAAKNQIDVFTGPLTVPDATTKAATGVHPNEATLNGHLNPAGGGEVTACSFEWGETEQYGHSEPCSPAPPYASEEEVSAVIAGLNSETTYHYRLTVANAAGGGAGSDQTLTTRPAVSALETEEATEIGAASANLNAVLTPEGAEITECTFQYLTQSGWEHNGYNFSNLSSGGSKSCAETAAEIGIGNSPVHVHAKVAGLSPETHYRFRIIAANQHGKTSGQESAFTTLLPITGLETEPATAVTFASATLNGVLTPDGIELTECAFEYGETEEYGHKVSCEETPAQIGTGTSPVHVHTTIALTPNTPYHFRIVAANEVGTGHGSDQLIPTPGAEADTVHSINGEEKITVFGTVEPGGADTHYHFEFVTEEQFEHEGFANATSTSEKDAGSSSGRAFVSAETPHLEPETGYRFRLTAESAGFPGDPVHSPTKTIPKPHPVEPAPENCPNEVDRYGASARLPDCRAYEQVTPAEKEGAQEIFSYGSSDATTSIANDGEHFLIGNLLSKWGNNVSGAAAGNYDFNRTPTGWEEASLSPQPQTKNVNNELYQLFNSGFSQFLIEPQWDTGPTRSEKKEYDLGPAGGPYTTVATEPNEEGGRGGWRGQSRDGSVAVIETADHELIPGHPTSTVGTGEVNQDLYGYYDGQLHQVNVETNGAPIGTSGTCGAEIVAGREAGERGGDRSEAGNGGNSTGGVNSISADGSRIFFYDSPGECAKGPGEMSSDGLLQGNKANLYMREPFAETTYDIGAYTFEGANPEGTRLLLGKYKAGGGGAEYFTYDTETHLAKHAFSTPYPISTGDWQAMSENGNDLYFENAGALNREATGGNNLWRYDLETETLTFIYHLDGTHGGPYGSPYAATEEGRGFYWMEEVPAEGNEQAYAYDSAEDVVECVACASPYDPEPKQSSFYMETGGPDTGHYAPLVTQASKNGDFVFFDTSSALLPNDINGELEPTGFQAPFSPSSDVYEWRRHGIDGCTARQGCLALITNGIDGYKNMLLGTDPSGKDVFIATESVLVAQDKDTQSDVYDARIGGGFPPPPPLPVQCEGDACHNPPNPPNDPTPSSSTYEGPGNEHHVPPKEAKKPTKHHKHHKGKQKSHKRAHRRAAGHNRGGAK